MDWQQAAAAIPLLEEHDVAYLQLSKEETEQVLILFNRAALNAQSDSADIAMIALKKLLSKYPSWGEAALLYGICLAIDGKLKRAQASFEYALSAGLATDRLTYLAQVCYTDAGNEYAQEKHMQQEEEQQKKGLVSSVLASKKRSSIFKEIETEERGHMQAPILTRASRAAGKAKLASDRERRDVMMKANTGGSEQQDEEIDISIPKTPAEKLRITVITLSSIAAAAVIGLLIWLFVIPAYQSFRENQAAEPRLSYLLAALEAVRDDPEVSDILAGYEAVYPKAGSGADASEQQSVTEEPSLTSQPSETTASRKTMSAVSASPSASVSASDPASASSAAQSSADSSLQTTASSQTAPAS